MDSSTYSSGKPVNVFSPEFGELIFNGSFDVRENVSVVIFVIFFSYRNWRTLYDLNHKATNCL